MDTRRIPHGAPLPIVATRAVPGGQPELVPIPACGGESGRDDVAVAARAEHSSVPPHATAAPVTSSEGAIYAILALAGVLVTAGVLFRVRQVRRSTP